VKVGGKTIGEIGEGLLILLGVEVEDSEQDADYIAKKIGGLRIFDDDDGLFNRSVHDVRGSVLVISQFTLMGDTRKGRRPSFVDAARPEQAMPLYESVIGHLRDQKLEVASGDFGAHMDVHLVNDGPVTILIDSKKKF